MTTSSRAKSSLRFTLDANILVYALNGMAGARHHAASEIVRRSATRDCLLTLQSISEFYSSATRKRLVAASDAAAQALDWLEIFPSVGVSPTAIRVALSHSLAHRASYWDALLIATAAEAGCSVVIGEDMTDGADFAGVRIYHPFTADGQLNDQTRQLLDL